ncbi:hypothetical protein QBC46DRAFT_425858 [Diplogelasinospora grovesii]|uniref:Mid2 domain-containing protein n=1 Tax=Diplogelasinospora grovesii TaxID=303347 RepID=A0AAN6NEF3_9PEZI|nr:hypothetical protein QBC46DRAFT_425858 [Diplogelasinospora grovesii]
MKPSTPTAGILISLAAANAGVTWAQFVTSTLTKTKTLTAHVRDDVATAVLLQNRQEEVTVQRTITTTEQRSQQPTVAPSSSPPSSQANSQQQQQQQQQSQSNEPQSTNIQADNTNSPTNSAPTGTATVSPDAGNSNGNHGPTKSHDGSSSSSSSSSSTPSSSSSGAAAAAAGHSSGGGGLGAGAAAGIAAGAVAGLALTAAVVFLLWRRKQGGARGAVITADYPRDYANQQQLSVDDESQGSRLPPMPTPMMMMRSPATFPRLEHQPGPAGMAGRQQQQPEYYYPEEHQSQYSLPPPAAAAAAAGNSTAIDHPDPFSDSPVVPPMPTTRRPTLDRFSFEAAVPATPQRHPQQQEAYPDYSGSGFGYSPGTVVDRPGSEVTGYYYQPGHSQSSSSTSSAAAAAVMHHPDGRGQESRPFSWEVPRDYNNDNNDNNIDDPRQQPQQTATARQDPPLPMPNVNNPDNTFELLPTFMIPGGDHQRARAMSFGGPSSSSSAARQRRATQREVPPQLPLPQPLSPLPPLPPPPPPLPPRSSGSWPLQGSEVVVQRGGGGGSRSGQRRRTMTTGAMDADMDTHSNTHIYE